MTPKSKPKLRMAPPPSALAEQQSAAARLLALDSWTEVPNNPPPTGLAATLVPEVLLAPLPVPTSPVMPAQPAPVPQVAAKPPAPMRAMKPWDEPSAAGGQHAYHFVMSEPLFRKLNFTWKRQGYQSMREMVTKMLEGEVDKMLKSLGEL